MQWFCVEHNLIDNSVISLTIRRLFSAFITSFRRNALITIYFSLITNVNLLSILVVRRIDCLASVFVWFVVVTRSRCVGRRCWALPPLPGYSYTNNLFNRRVAKFSFYQWRPVCRCFATTLLCIVSFCMPSFYRKFSKDFNMSRNGGVSYIWSVRPVSSPHYH